VQLSLIYRLDGHTTRVRQDIVHFVRSSGLLEVKFFSQGHTNGYTIPTPILAREFAKRSTLVAFTSTCIGEPRVRFGDAVCFVLDVTTGRKHAVIRRRVVSHQIQYPFNLRVESHVVNRPMQLVRVEDIICSCSEMLLPDMNPCESIVIFHQLSGDIHYFE
jgi:hypothetical protein